MFPFILRSNLTKTLNLSFFHHSYPSPCQNENDLTVPLADPFVQRILQFYQRKKNSRLKRSFQFILLAMKCFNLAFNTIFKIPNYTWYAKAISNIDMSEHAPTEKINYNPFLFECLSPCQIQNDPSILLGDITNQRVLRLDWLKVLKNK